MSEFINKKLKQDYEPTWEKKEKPEKAKIDTSLIRFAQSNFFDIAGKTLEIGSGSGEFLFYLLNKGVDITGIDISERAIASTKKKLLNCGKDDKQMQLLDFTNSKAKQMFPAEHFDTIIDAHCLHCIVEKEKRMKFLEHCNYLLKDDGVLFISTMIRPFNYKTGHLRTLYKIREDNIQYVRENIDQFGKYVPTRYFASLKELFTELETANLNIAGYSIHNSGDLSLTINLIAGKTDKMLQKLGDFNPSNIFNTKIR